MPTEQKQIVYVSIDITKEFPPQNGFYTVHCGDEFMGQKWYNHQDGGFNFPPITHWLNPVELSTLVEEQLKDNWISIDDRLPGNNDNVHVYSTCAADENCRIEVCFYNDLDKEWNGVSTPFLNKITHWQPLISPPKTK